MVFLYNVEESKAFLVILVLLRAENKRLLMDTDPAIFVIIFEDASKKLIFSAYYFLKLHLHHFSKIKSPKESQIVAIKLFLTIFA